MSQQTSPQATSKAPLDWKALQRALVFTKLVYRRPAVELPARKPANPRPIPTVEEVMSFAVGMMPSAATTSPALTGAAQSSAGKKKNAFDPYGEVDDRLLPWSWD